MGKILMEESGCHQLVNLETAQSAPAQGQSGDFGTEQQIDQHIGQQQRPDHRTAVVRLAAAGLFGTHIRSIE